MNSIKRPYLRGKQTRTARVWTRIVAPHWVRSNGPTDPLHIFCICSIWKILHFYSSFSLNPSKSAFFPVLTFIRWRLTPSYAAKDTIFWQKNTQNYRYQNYCPGWQYSNLFIWPSMWTRLEHAHCLETINNMWFLGKRECVNAWTVLCYSLTIICCFQVQDYIYWIISTENDHRNHHKFIKYEKRLRKSCTWKQQIIVNE
jgi:hypothetical protein